MTKEILDNFTMPITVKQAIKMNPLVLAFVGDAVQSLFVRTKAALSGDFKNGKLHLMVASEINATAQARAYECIKDSLTEEEYDIYRRARNTKSSSSAKNASVNDYRKATGFEAVLGFLYLTGNTTRALALMEICHNQSSASAKATQDLKISAENNNADITKTDIKQKI